MAPGWTCNAPGWASTAPGWASMAPGQCEPPWPQDESRKRRFTILFWVQYEYNTDFGAWQVNILDNIKFQILYFPLQDFTMLHILNVLVFTYQYQQHCKPTLPTEIQAIQSPGLLLNRCFWVPVSRCYKRIIIPREAQPCTECRSRKRIVKSDPDTCFESRVFPLVARQR